MGGAWSDSLGLLCWMQLGFAVTSVLVSNHLSKDSEGTSPQNVRILPLTWICGMCYIYVIS